MTITAVGDYGGRADEAALLMNLGQGQRRIWIPLVVNLLLANNFLRYATAIAA
jgi:hypothetical protein